MDKQLALCHSRLRKAPRLIQQQATHLPHTLKQSNMQTQSSNVFLWVALLFTTGACSSKTVLLNVKNPTDQQQNVTIGIKEEGKDVSKISLGAIAPHDEESKGFEVNYPADITVSATNQEGRQMQDASFTVTELDSYETPKTVELAYGKPVAGGKLPVDNKAAIEELNAKFRSLGTNRGFLPLPEQSARESMLGALIVYSPPEKPEKTSEVYFALQPARFSGSVQAETLYANNRDSVKKVFTSAIKGEVTLAIPGFDMKISSGAEEVYEFSAEMSGYGMVPRVEPADWSYASGLEGLADAEKRALIAAAKMPRAVIVYIDKMYVVKTAQYALRKGSRVSSAVEGKTAWSTTSGDWIISDEASEKRDFSDSAVNFDGIVLSLDAVDDAGAALKALSVSGDSGAGNKAKAEMPNGTFAILRDTGRTIGLDSKTLAAMEKVLGVKRE